MVQLRFALQVRRLIFFRFLEEHHLMLALGAVRQPYQAEISALSTQQAILQEHTLTLF